jgi:hypothetical protein
MVAGALIVAASILFWFVPWSLLAWGFSLHMLRVLAVAPAPVTLEQWIGAYTIGASIDTLARNRLQVLLRFGMSRRADDRIAVTRLGSVVAAAAGAIRMIMGLR